MRIFSIAGKGSSKGTIGSGVLTVRSRIGIVFYRELSDQLRTSSGSVAASFQDRRRAIRKGCRCDRRRTRR
jgi:hypothetical protein